MTRPTTMNFIDRRRGGGGPAMTAAAGVAARAIGGVNDRRVQAAGAEALERGRRLGYLEIERDIVRRAEAAFAAGRANIDEVLAVLLGPEKAAATMRASNRRPASPRSVASSGIKPTPPRAVLSTRTPTTARAKPASTRPKPTAPARKASARKAPAATITLL